jgi:hypothetical protein
VRVRDVLSLEQMPTEHVMPELDASFAVPGAAEWLALSDDLLAGLVHALNNRVTALSVCAELAGFGDKQMLSDGILLAEVARLQRASALVGMLPARGLPEALEIAPVLHDAIAIHSHHPRMRAAECSVDVQSGMEPVRVPRWALLRALLFVVDAAKRGVQGPGAQTSEPTTATVRLRTADGVVQVRAPAREIEGTYATEMASLCGGALEREGGELVLTLPTLTELRRRERGTGRVG